METNKLSAHSSEHLFIYLSIKKGEGEGDDIYLFQVASSSRITTRRHNWFRMWLLVTVDLPPSERHRVDRLCLLFFFCSHGVGEVAAPQPSAALLVCIARRGCWLHFRTQPQRGTHSLFNFFLGGGGRRRRASPRAAKGTAQTWQKIIAPCYTRRTEM